MLNKKVFTDPTNWHLFIDLSIWHPLYTRRCNHHCGTLAVYFIHGIVLTAPDSVAKSSGATEARECTDYIRGRVMCVSSVDCLACNFPGKNFYVNSGSGFRSHADQILLSSGIF